MHLTPRSRVRNGRSLAIGRRSSQQCWGVTAGKASHNSCNVRGVTAGKVGRNSSEGNELSTIYRYMIEYDKSMAKQNAKPMHISNMYRKWQHSLE